MKKIEIVCCSDSLMWYSRYVGKTFPLLGVEDEIFWTKEPEGYKNLVYRHDAKIVEEEISDDTLGSLANSLVAISEIFQKAAVEWEKIEEEKWNALSEEDKLDIFCAVVRRIHRGELVEERSYRGMLYDVFGFDESAYIKAQNAGYIEIHNSIFRHKD